MRKKKVLMLGLMGVTAVSTVALASCDTTVNPLFEKVEEKVSIVLNYGYDNITENVEILKNDVYNSKSLTREGYNFVGWYMDANCTQAFVCGSTVSSNLVLYAKWEAKVFITISYEVDGQDYVSATFEKGHPALGVPDPEKTGYTFAGWYVGDELLNANALTQSVVANARFTINTYTVTFDLSGGTASNVPTEAEYNSTITLPTPTKEGFNFKEFVDADGNKYAAGATATITKNTTFTAVFEAVPVIPTVLITLNYNDGRANKVDEIIKNSAYNTSTPTRDGYTFAGWYSDESLQTAFNSGTSVYNNITLYAKWNINKYTVIINANDGKIANEDNYVLNDVEYNTSLNSIVEGVEAVRVGYKAVGFSLTENGNALTAEEIASLKITSATTLYVVWAETVAVNFEFNGGKLDDASSKTVNVIKNSTLEGLTPAREGYTLVGWSLELDGEKLASDYQITQATTLYAVWEIVPSENNITITLKKIDVLINKEIAEDFTKVINKGEKITNVNVFDAAYYLVSVTDTEGNNIDLDTVYQATTTVIAKYIKKNYTFNNQKEAFVFSEASTSVVDDNNVIELKNSLSATNYIKFSVPEGFKATLNIAYKAKSTTLASDKTFNVRVSLNDNYSDGIEINSENLEAQTSEYIFYAVNEENNILIGRQGNTGGYITSISVDLVALEPVTLTAINGEESKNIRAYKDMAYADFLGEYEQKGYMVEYYADAEYQTSIPSASVITANKTVYIKKTLIDYNVTFKDGDEQISKETLHIGDAITAPNMSKEGFRFVGFYNIEDSTKAIVDFTNLKCADRSVTFVAVWVEQVTVTFKAEGQVVDTKVIDINTNVELPTAPEKTGYRFTKWYVGEDEFTGQNVEASVEVLAMYVIKSYEVNINLDGGDAEVNIPTSANHGTEITLPEVTKDGYEFVNYTDGTNTYAAGDKLTVTDNVNLTVTWKEMPGVEWIHVTLDYNYDGATETKKIQKGSVLNTTKPARSGYEFAGWFSDDKFQTEFVSGTSVETDATLYAKWLEIFEVKFVVGEEEFAVQNITDGKKAQALEDAPTKEGEKFEGWFADADFKTAFDFTTPITKATTIYGKWQFKVTFEGLEGTTFVSTNGIAAIPNGIPTKDGFQFIDWIDADKAITADTQIKATWLQNKWVLTDNLANADAVTTAGFIVNEVGVSSKKVRFTKLLTGDKEEDYANYIAISVPKTGLFEFDLTLLWQTSNKPQLTIIYTSNGEVVTYNTGSADNKADKAVKFSALIDANTKIYFAETKSSDEGSKAGSLDISAATITATYGDVVILTIKDGADVLKTTRMLAGSKLSLEEPEKAHYNFVGFVDEDDNEFTATSISADTTIYAKFEIQKFDVTFDANGGKFGDETKGVVEDVPYATTLTQMLGGGLPMPTYAGYGIAGVATTADGTPLTNEEMAEFVIDSDKTLYIIWAKVNKVTFKDGDTVVEEQELFDGEELNVPSMPTPEPKDGYLFGGWFIDNNTEFTFTTDVTTDIVVTAKWNKLYDVYYYDGEKSEDNIVAEENVEEGKTATRAATDPSKEHYEFKYWAIIVENAYVEYDFTTAVTTDLDLYAYYVLQKHTITSVNDDGSATDTTIADEVEYGTEITLVAPNERTGYTFLNYTIDGTDYAADAKYTITADVTITAVWKANAPVRSITYELDGGTNGQNPSSFTRESADIALVDATKEGYNFLGWYTDLTDDTTKIETIANGTDSDLTLYAKFEIKKFTLTIHGNGGVLNENDDETLVVSDIEYGKNLTEVNMPMLRPDRPGYNCSSYQIGEGKNAQVINDMVSAASVIFTENKDMYFIWTICDYTITYDLDGGTNAADNPTKYTIETDTITLKDATKEGYTFDGWYNGETKVETIAKGSTGQVSVKAKFTMIKYTIAFDANSTTATGTMDSIENINWTKEEALTANAFTNPGYEFLGWNTKADGSGTSIADEATVTKLTNEEETVTLYAQWKLVSALYTFGGSVTSNYDKVNVALEKTETSSGVVQYIGSKEGNEKSIDGYSFNTRFKTGGKSTSTSGVIIIDLTSYTGKAKVTVYGMSGKSGTTRTATLTNVDNVGTTTNAFLTLSNDGSEIGKSYALINCGSVYYLGSIKDGFNIYGIRIEFGEFNNVTFENNGGTGNVAAQLIKKGEKATAPTTNPTKEHYTFANWCTRSGEENAYVYTPYDFDSAVNEALVLYATWTPEEYTVTFDANSGEFAQNVETTQKVIYNEYIATQTEPTRYGYTFTGWNSKADGTGVDYSTTAGAIDGAITLYAKWEAKDVTVTLNANGGKFGEDNTKEITVKFNSKISEATGYTTPTSTSGAFVKWTGGSAEDSGDYDVDALVNTEDAIVIYAQYATKITVTFYNGTTEYASVEVDVNAKVSKPKTDPTRDNCTFKNWYVDEDATALFDFDNTEITIPTSIYAIFEAVVTFDGNDGKFGENTTATQTVICGKNIETQEEPTNGDYVFGGWYLDAECKNEFDSTKAINADITVYAKWFDTIEVLTNSVSNYDFTTLTSAKDVTDSKKYGAFTLDKGNHSKFKEQNGYISMYIGNTITFNVKNDGAVFMISYNNNNASRKVILTSDNTSYTSTTKFTKDFTQNNYTFNNVTLSLETSTKGWLIFENLKAGNYTVSFDTDEVDKNNNSLAGVVGKGEQKIERLKLLDTSNLKVTLESLIFDTEIGSINRLNVKNVKAQELNSNREINLDDSQFVIFVDENNYSNNLLIPGKHKVEVKYGKYTSYSEEIVVADYDFVSTTNITYDTTTSEFVGTNADKIVVTGTAIASSGQFSQDTVATFYVNKLSKVVITGYDKSYGLFDIYINEVKQDLEISDDGEYSFVVNADSEIQLKTKNVGTEDEPAYNKSYIKGIEVVDYFATCVPGTTTIAWNKDLATPAFEGTNLDKFEIIGSLRNNGDGSAQFSGNTSITFVAKKYSEITISTHSKTHGVFDIYVNGKLSNVESSDSGVYKFSVTDDSKIEIKTSNASYSYIRGIEINDYLSSNTITENSTITWDKTDKEFKGDYVNKLAIVGTLTDHADGSAVYSNNTSITFSVNDCARITVIGHSETYGVFDIYVNGVKQDLTISSTGLYVFTVAENSVISIKTSNPSYSYIKGLKVEYAVVDDTKLVFFGNASEGQIKWADNTQTGIQSHFVITGTDYSNSSYLEFKNSDKIEFYVIVPTGKKAVLIVSYYNDVEGVIKLGSTTIDGTKDTTNSSNTNYIYTYNLASTDVVTINAIADQNYLNYISISFVDAE